MAYFLRAILIVFIYSSILIFNHEECTAQTKNVAVEQDNPRENIRRSILVLSHEKILNSTNLGLALIEKLQKSENTLRLEAEEAEKYFIAEEKKLTVDRKNLTPKDFLAMSDDFDKRVELERLNQRQKEKTIKRNFNKWKRKFYNSYMIPIVEQFMQGYGASIVIDIDSQAFRSIIYDSRLNITDRVISEMNTAYRNIEEIVLKITS